MIAQVEAPVATFASVGKEPTRNTPTARQFSNSALEFRTLHSLLVSDRCVRNVKRYRYRSKDYFRPPLSLERSMVLTRYYLLDF